MEVISIIVMFLFGNMSDTEDRMTQYIPMENLSSCLKEKRILARDKEFKITKNYTLPEFETSEERSIYKLIIVENNLNKTLEVGLP